MTTGAPGQPPTGGGDPRHLQPQAPAKPADPAQAASLMLVIAAALIMIATISKGWFTAGGGVRMGPIGAEACFASRCVSVATSNLNVPGDIEALAMIAMLAGFAAAAAAGLFGGMSLAGRRGRIPLSPKAARVVFAIAGGSMTLFMIRMLSDGADISWAGFAGIGGVILAATGLKKLLPFLAVAAHQQARDAFVSMPTVPSMPPPQRSQPMQPYGQQASQPHAQQSQPMQPHGQQPLQPYQHHPQLATPHMAPPQTPPPSAQSPCPRCGTQLQFVAQYQRWFCPREQQYV